MFFIPLQELLLWYLVPLSEIHTKTSELSDLAVVTVFDEEEFVVSDDPELPDDVDVLFDALFDVLSFDVLLLAVLSCVLSLILFTVKTDESLLDFLRAADLLP